MDDSKISTLSLPAKPPSASTSPIPSPRICYLESVPTWKNHEWAYSANEIDPKLELRQTDQDAIVPASSFLHSSDSDEEAQSDSDEDYGNPLEPKQTRPRSKKVLFPISDDLNSRISLWLGDVTLLKVDAVVNPTTVTTSDKSGVGGRILDVAGWELISRLKTDGRPKTGEVRATRGFNLLTQPTLLHTVGPRYSEQYYTAAESALHLSYRSVLDYCFENKLNSVAIPPIHSVHRKFPPLLGAHIAIRTIRRLMMLRPQAMERIVLVFDKFVDGSNIDNYLAVMKLYFPRTQAELSKALELLPEDNADEFGETIVEERKVRINATFVASRIGHPADNDSDDDPYQHSDSSQSFISPASGPTVAAGERDDVDKNSFPASMRSMTMNRDSERRINAGTTATSDYLENLYQHYLQLARKTDLSPVSGLGLFYHAGNDHLQRPIIAIVGCRLPAEPQQHDLVFLHYLEFMDNFANHPYIILYIHTDVTTKPELAWLKKVYSIMDAKYGQSLVAIHVLHPTFWLKVFEKLCSVFMSSTYVLDKIVYHDRLVDLCAALRTVPRLPDDIMAADAAINGALPRATVEGLARQIPV